MTGQARHGPRCRLRCSCAAARSSMTNQAQDALFARRPGTPSNGPAAQVQAPRWTRATAGVRGRHAANRHHPHRAAPVCSHRPCQCRRAAGPGGADALVRAAARAIPPGRKVVRGGPAVAPAGPRPALLEHTQWRAQGASSYADKWPENYLAIGHILAAMPAARVLCVVRDPIDPASRTSRSGSRLPTTTATTWRKPRARRARFRRLLIVQALAHPRVASVGYEAFVERPRDSIAAIAGALSLPARQEGGAIATHTIATASAVQARDAVVAATWARGGAIRGRCGPMLAERLERCGVAASDT